MQQTHLWGLARTRAPILRTGGPGVLAFMCLKTHRRNFMLGNQMQDFGGKGNRRLPSHRSTHVVGSAENPDLIEKLVGTLFGKKALEDPEPAGMKRMSEEALAEQYPATTTEFAEPVAGDTPDVAAFRPLLARTRLETRALRLAYDANSDGWSAQAFHTAVDTYGAAVVVARTAGAIFGGYNPRGWIGLGDERNAISAFLFTWTDGDTSKPAVKLPKVGGGALAIIDKAEEGPRFGAEGLTIPLAAGRERLARCRLGTYYSRRPDGGRTLFAEGEEIKGAQLLELKVYVAEGGPEQWELDGIVWKSSQA